MSQEQKLQRFLEEREIYLQECRAEYGYEPRAKARTIRLGNKKDFISVFFFCTLAFTVFMTVDYRSCRNFLASAEQMTVRDVYKLVVSNLRD